MDIRSILVLPDSSVSCARSSWAPYRFCSQWEAKNREKLLDIHFLEATDATFQLSPAHRVMDPCRAVKKYCRTGTENHHLKTQARSIEELKDTVEYLITDIWQKKIILPHFSCNNDTVHSYDGQCDKALFSCCYGFCMDRLAAVRQEIVTYRMNDQAVVTLLMRIVWFYSHSLYASNTVLDERDINGTSASEYGYSMLLHEQALTTCITTTLDVISACLSALPCEITQYIKECRSVLLQVRFLFNVCVSVRSSFAGSAKDNPSISVVMSDATTAVKHAGNPLLFTNSLFVQGDVREFSRPSVSYLELFQQTVIKFTACLQQSNPVGAIRTISKSLVALREKETTDATTAFAHHVCHTVIFYLNIFAWYILPELRIWSMWILYHSSHNKIANNIPMVIYSNNCCGFVITNCWCAFICVRRKYRICCDLRVWIKR